MSAWDVIRAEFEDTHTQAFMLWMAFMTVQPADRPGTGPRRFARLRAPAARLDAAAGGSPSCRSRSRG